ncbi:hypothetical protein IIV22_166L [Invertebrate iridescent virus 22]|uniref:Uncharacterized protein n=1 Tax=Invertebrate iridescent virus 22 TaxID=345198 RepID=S6DAA1_9VIRU|nr:hypothetical protein IIV22_166L [Invertebrate iridescent virus 22]CCV01843.1 hypothetical protein IIV22_166L [Invertebrate iridescent virus 22]
MIDIILIIITVMFGTLLFDRNKRSKFIIKEGFNLPYGLANRKKCTTLQTEDGEMASNYTFDLPQGGNITLAESQIFTPSYAGFLNNYQVFGSTGYSPGTPQENKFSVYSLNSNMETYQPIDFDNNIASLYGYKPDGYDTSPKGGIITCTESDGLMGVNRWCGCESLSTTGTTETSTRRLIGGVNPRTLIPPRIVPPITDIDEWGTDNYTIHSATNNYRSDDLFLSGYITLDDCKCKGVCNCKKNWNKPLIKENFNDDVFSEQNTQISGHLGPLTTRVNNRCRGTLLTDCGGENLKEVVADHNFLSPYDVSEQRLTRPQILQNGGISRIPEKSVYTSITNGDDLLFLEQTSKKNTNYTTDYITGDEPSMIYDPRMVGYSDPKRGYIDKLLGQPKFYYDDINAARAPNYITRNKIDIYSFGESTGRLRHPKEMCGDNNQLAVEEFHNSTLQHRADIMQSLMSKRNSEMWQLREFPIYTGGQRMLGGTSKI